MKQEDNIGKITKDIKKLMPRLAREQQIELLGCMKHLIEVLDKRRKEVIK